MDYNNFLDTKNDKTVRRLELILSDMDGTVSGMLYGAFRKMSNLQKYSPRTSGYTEQEKEIDFNFFKDVVKEQTKWVNDWMNAHGKLDIFRDVSNWQTIGEDFDYFWMLRSEKQFAEEESDAKKGKNGRYPVETHYNNIDVEKFLQQLESPSLDD